MKKESIGTLSLLGAGVFWGTSGTAQTFAPTGYDPLIIGLLRLSIGGLVLMAIAVSFNQIGPLSSWPIRTMLLGAVCVAAFQVFFFTGLYKTGVAVGTIVGLGSAPICAGILAYLMRGERPGPRWYAATLLAVLGCMVLLYAGRNAEVLIHPLGILLSIGAGLSYALYAVAVKDLVAVKPCVAVMAVLACLGTCLLLPLLWQRELQWVVSGRAVLVALYLGVFSYAVPMALFARGLSLTPVAVAVTLTLAEPVTAGILGVVIVGEQLSAPAWLGLFLVMLGLLTLSFRSKNEAAAEP